MKKTALISVYNKENIEKFAKDLVDLGWKIISSDGTAKYLSRHGVKTRNVSEIVGGEAILGHRVVTLSREIHAGLLARPDVPEDMAELKKLNIPFIDLVCVDFYPLEYAIAKPDASYDSVIEATDVGGPTLIRSAAKGGRIVICEPEDRKLVANKLRTNGDLSEVERIDLAAKAEFVAAKYCLESAKFHSKEKYDGIVGEQIAETLYGENPQQIPGKLYKTRNKDSLALDKFQVLTEMAPSFNNLCDIDRMLQTLTHISEAFDINNIKARYFGVAVKHGNSCGAAYGDNKIEVIQKVIEGDLRAIFGGIAMFNFSFGEGEVETLLTHFMEKGQRRLMDGIVTAGFTEKALKIARRKKDKCRLIINSALAKLDKNSLDAAKRFRYVRGGFLAQPNYTFIFDYSHPDIEISGKVSERIKKDMLLAWAICATSNSNTITLVKDGKLIGNGVGQQDRVVCADLAVKRARDAGHEIQGSVAASDSFFPFPDAPLALADCGIKAIISTSGSVNDKQVREALIDKKIAFVQLPDKHSRGFFGH
jgi:phosphoribosylaminoimidazolecarboxamide formyltransferase / IMP cyclohydrolase